MPALAIRISKPPSCSLVSATMRRTSLALVTSAIMPIARPPSPVSVSSAAACFSALRPAIAERALGATFRGEPLAVLAERVLDVASSGLARRARMRNGKDETVHLARLSALVEKGQCPADELLEGLDVPDGEADLRREILSRARI